MKTIMDSSPKNLRRGYAKYLQKFAKKSKHGFSGLSCSTLQVLLNRSPDCSRMQTPFQNQSTSQGAFIPEKMNAHHFEKILTQCLLEKDATISENPEFLSRPDVATKAILRFIKRVYETILLEQYDLKI